MPSQQQRNAPVTAPQSTESGPTTTESGPSNSEVQGQMTGPEGGGEAAAPTTTKKGPNNYTMTGPWSLRALSGSGTVLGRAIVQLCVRRRGACAIIQIIRRANLQYYGLSVLY